jgi:predicted dehydrogenase
MQAYRDQITAFLAAIAGEEAASTLPLVGTGADGRAAVAVCRAMLASSAERRWIDLPQ